MPRVTPLDKIDFFNTSSYKMQISFWLRGGIFCLLSSLPAVTSLGLILRRSSVWQKAVSLHVSALFYLEKFVSLKSSIASSSDSLSSSTCTQIPELLGEGSDEGIRLELIAPESLTFCTLPSCGSLC